jgi:hypothetical protein
MSCSIGGGGNGRGLLCLASVGRACAPMLRHRLLGGCSSGAFVRGARLPERRQLRARMGSEPPSLAPIYRWVQRAVSPQAEAGDPRVPRIVRPRRCMRSSAVAAPPTLSVRSLTDGS